MLDFMKGLFVWLGKYILFLFFPLIGSVVFFFENFPETMKSIWNYFTSWISWYFQDFYLWLFQQLTDKLTNFFSGNDFIVSVAELSNSTFTLINVFLPLNEACACLSFIAATMTAVFLIRLTLKAIPTIW